MNIVQPAPVVTSATMNLFINQLAVRKMIMVKCGERFFPVRKSNFRKSCKGVSVTIEYSLFEEFPNHIYVSKVIENE